MAYNLKDKSLEGFDSLSRKEKVIFLAGVFDGEGCIGCYTNGKTEKYLNIIVESTDRDSLERFVEVFGGTILQPKKRFNHYKDIFRWKRGGKKAWTIIEEMIPYMCKRRREKYATLEHYRHSSKDSGRIIQKQESLGDSSIRS